MAAIQGQNVRGLACIFAIAIASGCGVGTGAPGKTDTTMPLDTREPDRGGPDLFDAADTEISTEIVPADVPSIDFVEAGLPASDVLPDVEDLPQDVITEYCPCDRQVECGRVPEYGCGMVCAISDGAPKDYADLCAMKADFRCDDAYQENLHNLGSCAEPACVPCFGVPDNPVCGSDGETYANHCLLANCPNTTGAIRACLGACIGEGFCSACPANCQPVCGDDNITYGNACAATTCGTKDQLVAYDGSCCPMCDNDPMIEACATNGKTYRNYCQALCHGASPCGMDGPTVCGLDGRDYLNTCWATCKAGGNLHDGPCATDL